MKKKVTYLGYQEKLDGTKFLLVNEIDTHSTVVFDRKKHILIRDNEMKNSEKVITFLLEKGCKEVACKSRKYRQFT